MSRLRLVGAVAIKVRPDTSEFREETQKGINRELGNDGKKVDAKAKVEVSADTTRAKREFKNLEQELDGKTFKLNVGLDYDSVQKAKAQIDRAMDSLKNKVIDFNMNEKDLAEVRQQLRDLQKTVRVKMEYVKDEAGYRSILAKIEKIRREKATIPISFHTDEASLRKEERKAKEALARIEADKTVDIRYSDNYEGMKKALGELDAQLDEIRKLKITTKLDEASLLAAKGELQDMMQFADVTIKFNEDKQGYETVLSRIRAIQREKLEKEITFSVDDESLRREARKYEDLIAQANEREQIAAQFAPVTIEYNEDLEGYKSALAHIKKLQREKLVKKLSVNLDEASLQRELDKFQALVDQNTPAKTIEFQYNYGRDSLLSTLKRVDDEISKSWDIKIPIGADTASLVAFRAKLQALANSAPVEMKINEDKAGFQSVIDKIKSIQRERAVVDVTFDTDPRSLELKLKEMQAKLRQFDSIKFTTAVELNRLSVEEALHEAKKLNDKIDDMKGSMKVELNGSALVSARLSFLGRDRVVNYFANVNTRSIALAEGLLKSLGGINTLSAMGRGIENLFTKFDTLSLKIGTAATALGSLANVGVYAFTAVVKVGEGVVQSLGLLAAAPAILGAATVGYTIFTAAFNNFFDAFNKDPKIAAESLKALPPIARKTVDSITGLYKGLANPIQEKFWEHVGTTLSDSIETLYPKLKESLLNSTTAVGDFVAGVGKSFNKLALSDDFDKMFAGFNGFFTNLSGASEPFFDAWNKLGVQGSTLLPEFGNWITKLAKQFDSWATNVSANGGITDMIMHGVSSLQNMWKVGGDVINIFKALSKAAGLAGTGGLAQFELNLRKTAERMNAEPWQSKAATIFEGARKGASGLNEGFHDLTGTLGDSAVWLGNVLNLLGQIGGQSMSRLADLFGSTTYQNGVTAELNGMLKLAGDLGPAFRGLGDIIGNMGVVAGSVFGGLGPVINQVVGLLDDVTTTLSASLADVAPKMLASVSGIITVITPLVQGLATALNGILTLVGKVPDGFILASVAAAAYFGLRGLSSKFYDSLSGTSAFKNLESKWLAQQALAGKTVESYKMVNGAMQKIEVPTGKFNLFSAGIQAIKDGAGNLKTQFETVQRASSAADMGKFRSNLNGVSAVMGTLASNGIKGLLSALGGPWGIGLAAAGIIIGIFAQQMQNAKKHVDDLTASVDKQTGQLNTAGLEKVAKSWTDLNDAGDAWANLWRGAKAGNETAKALGLNFANVTKTIAEGGAPAEKLYGDLFKLSDAMSMVDQIQTNFDGSGLMGLDQAQSDAESAAGAFGLTTEKIQEMGLSAGDIKHLAENLKDEADAAKVAKAVVEGLAEATGTTTIQASQMAAAMKTIGDESQTAASKIGAINKALDLLKGGTLSAREAEVNAQSAFQTAVSNAAALKEELADNKHLINSTTGLIDETSTSGLKLQQIMTTAADGIKVAAMAAYTAATDAGKPPAEAMKAAQAVIEGHKGDLKGIADAAGVDVAAIQKEWEGFFGKKWELNAVFSASADKFEAAKKVVEDAGLQWNDAAFEAILAANPDPAKLTMDQAKAAGEKYANGQYKAILDAQPQDALMKILEATGQAENYRKGDYTAVMKALNSTDPGVAAATQGLWNAVNNGGKGWAAAIQAYMDAVSAANTRNGLDAIANAKRVAVISVQYTNPDGPDPGTAGRGTVYAQGLNGGIILPGMSPFSGPFPMQKARAFLNGGITMEDPSYAKIYSPAAQFRLFAEPATGGEAFIPLSASKRNRSTQILSEVARQFGFTLSKTKSYANGGIAGGGGGGGTHIHIDAQPGLSYQYAQEVAYAAQTRFRDAQAVYNITN